MKYGEEIAMNDDNERIPVDITPEKDKSADKLDVVVLEDDQAPALDDDSNDTDPLKAIETLKKKLKMEQEARLEAEQRAQKAAFQAQKASHEVEDTQMHLVANAIETIKRDNEILTANYAESMRNGNFEDAARIQMALSQNSSNLKQLEDGHVRMQEDARNKPTPPAEPPQPLKPEQQIDQIIGQVSKPSAQWLKENRDRFEDERTINKMFRAHGDAVDDGIEPDTPEYFRYIEKRLGFKQDEHGGSPMSSAAKPSSRQSAPPSAPVNRDSGRSNVAHLTRAQADTAKALGMTEKEYATHMIALQKEGRLTH
jgi:hypothetical protein